jgi:MoxR-like ATPase
MSDLRTVPPISEEFVPGTFRWKWYDRVKQHVARTHVLLIAEHGVGKTYTLRSIAAERGRPFWYVSASFGLERASLEGQYLPVYHDGHIGLEPMDGIVASAAAAGGDLMIDEFFRLPQDTQSNLFACMDAHRSSMSIAYRGGNIQVPESFRVIGATNPPSPMYPEVEIADRALLSRFGAVIRLPYPDGKELARYLKAVEFPRDRVVQTIHFAVRVKASFDKGDLDNFVSPRDLLFFGAALSAGMDHEQALEDTVVGKFHDRYHEAIRGFYRMQGKGAEGETMEEIK